MRERTMTSSCGCTSILFGGELETHGSSGLGKEREERKSSNKRGKKKPEAGRSLLIVTFSFSFFSLHCPASASAPKLSRRESDAHAEVETARSALIFPREHKVDKERDLY